MDYGSLSKELEDILEFNFDIESFNKIGKIYDKLTDCYHSQLKISGIDKKFCGRMYQLYYDNFCTMVKNKLTEKLGFEPEQIEQIHTIIKTRYQIKKMYVIDGVVIAINGTDKAICSLDGKYLDISSDEFFESGDNDALVYSVMDFINGIISSSNRDSESEPPITIKNGKFAYTVPDLWVCVNNNLARLKEDNTNTRVLIYHNGELSFCDIRMQSERLVELSSKYKIHVIADMLSDRIQK